MPAVTITLGNKSKTLEYGESYTFACSGQMLSVSNNLSITFNTEGYFTYNGLTTVGQNGKTRVLLCSASIMASDIVITGGSYGGSFDSAIPPEIRNEQAMLNILNDATSVNAGSVYKYVGETGLFEKDSLYIIAEEE